MSVKYSNQYNAYHPGGLEWDHATSCDWARRLGDGEIDERFVRVEMRINGHWHRPPVGMRADQASHVWGPTIVGSGSVEHAEIIEVLRPRPKTALEI